MIVAGQRLRRHVTLVSTEDDDGGTAPELYLALWRPFAANEDPTEEQGHFFQSVLVAPAGYDGTPAGHRPDWLVAANQAIDST